MLEGHITVVSSAPKDGQCNGDVSAACNILDNLKNSLIDFDPLGVDSYIALSSY